MAGLYFQKLFSIPAAPIIDNHPKLGVNFVFLYIHVAPPPLPQCALPLRVLPTLVMI